MEGQVEPTSSRRDYLSKRNLAAAALVALALAFVIQNGEEAKVTFVFTDVTAPLWIALTASFLVGALVGVLASRKR